MKELANLVPLLVDLFACFCPEDCRANDTITITKPIHDPESVVSTGQTYKLGFFSPANTSNRYVGIIFNKFPQLTVLWVANRNQPLNDSGGIFSISEDGNLRVLNGQKEVLCSSNASNSVANCSAQLLDTGNLVLRDNSNGMILWESFRHPTDTTVCKLRLGASPRNKNRLTSWKSPSDPSIGSFSLGFDPPGIPEVFIWDQSQPLRRSGPWDGDVFIGGETVKLIDPRIFDPCIEMEVLRYIHVGLLCVQEHAKDRPNVSTVLSMLNSEIVEIPCPNLTSL